MNSPNQKNFIRFTLNDGMSVTSNNTETVQALVELLISAPTLDKKNAYFIVDNQIVFLENVNFIKWNLVEEETA